ncbi:hypothetical protein A0130_06225 [Leifsonia xyli]|nr:hypothetical protein A0130_06225 [Leifsonia xyli]
MQLSILFYLLWTRSGYLPANRYELFSAYMERYLDRESKSADVRKHRKLIEEVTAYLGWHLHSLSEVSLASSQITRKELRQLLAEYLIEREQDLRAIDSLFYALRERVWVLVSRVQGTYEFEVQPIREYFAARYIADTAAIRELYGGADKIDRLVQLAERPFWMNVMLFFVGTFTSGERRALAATLTEMPEQSRYQDSLAVQASLLALLSDGVLNSLPTLQLSALRSIFNARWVRVFARDPAGWARTHHLGDVLGEQLLVVLGSHVHAAPTSPLAQDAAQLLAKQIDSERLLAWWEESISADGQNVMQWLDIRPHLELPIEDNVEFDDESTRSICQHPRLVIRSQSRSAIGIFGDSELVASLLRGYGHRLPQPDSAPNALLLCHLLALDSFLNAPNGRLLVGPPTGHLSIGGIRQRIEDLQVQFPSLDRVLHGLVKAAANDMSTAFWIDIAQELLTLDKESWLARELCLVASGLPNAKFYTAFEIPGGEEQTDFDIGAVVREIRANRVNLSWWKHHILNATPDEAEFEIAAAVLFAPQPDMAMLTAMADLTALMDEGGINRVVRAIETLRALASHTRKLDLQQLVGIANATTSTTAGLYLGLEADPNAYGRNKLARAIRDRELPADIGVMVQASAWTPSPHELAEMVQLSKSGVRATSYRRLSLTDTIDLSEEMIAWLPSGAMTSLIPRRPKALEPLAALAESQRWFSL